MRLPSASSPSFPPEAAPRHAAVYIVVGVSDPAPYCVLLQNPSLSLVPVALARALAHPGSCPPYSPTPHTTLGPGRFLPACSLWLFWGWGEAGGDPSSTDLPLTATFQSCCRPAAPGQGWGHGAGRHWAGDSLPGPCILRSLPPAPWTPKARRCLPARLHLPWSTLPAQPSRESTPVYPHSTAPHPCPHAHVAASICPCDREPLRCRRAQGTNSPSRRCLSRCFCQRLLLLCYRAGGLPQMADRHTDSRLCASNTQWSEIPTSSPTIFQLTARFEKETSIVFFFCKNICFLMITSC